MAESQTSVPSIAPIVLRAGRSPGLKFFLIAFLALLLIIPLVMISSLLSERAGRARQVAAEVGASWGNAQTLAGPILVVPYAAQEPATQSGPQPVVQRVAIFLPDSLAFDSDATVELRQRSIFEVPVYRSQSTIKAAFPAADVKGFDPQAVNIHWNEAVLALGISDLRGLKNNLAATLGDGTAIAFEPGMGGQSRFQVSGMHAPLRDLDSAKPITVSLGLELNGSQSLSFTPLGRSTTVVMRSNWASPSFFGQFLPDERRIGEAGFEAKWSVPYLARSIPQKLRLEANTPQTLFAATLGARFYQPVDFYQLVERAVKYAVLFIGVVFMAVFGMELTSGKLVHAVQYAFVGAALVLFYVLLLSLSEHVGFHAAYAAAAGATTLLIASYVGLVLQDRLRGLVTALVLAAGYGLLFMLLRSEDYALLVGSVAAFVGLAVLMFGTLRVDWSGMVPRKGEAAAPALAGPAAGG